MSVSSAGREGRFLASVMLSDSTTNYLAYLIVALASSLKDGSDKHASKIMPIVSVTLWFEFLIVMFS